jgi:hypothetical protein
MLFPLSIRDLLRRIFRVLGLKLKNYAVGSVNAFFVILRLLFRFLRPSGDGKTNGGARDEFETPSSFICVRIPFCWRVRRNRSTNVKPSELPLHAPSESSASFVYLSPMPGGIVAGDSYTRVLSSASVGNLSSRQPDYDNESILNPGPIQQSSQELTIEISQTTASGVQKHILRVRPIRAKEFMRYERERLR